MQISSPCPAELKTPGAQEGQRLLFPGPPGDPRQLKCEKCPKAKVTDDRESASTEGKLAGDRSSASVLTPDH